MLKIQVGDDGDCVELENLQPTSILATIKTLGELFAESKITVEEYADTVYFLASVVPAKLVCE